MKNFLISSLKKIGLVLNKYPRSGFEYLLNNKRYEAQTIDLLGLPFNISDSDSFYYSHREIFIDGIYEFKTMREIPKIIDCGTNYGTSLVYFKSLYANAEVIGIEADPNIFSILEKNISLRKYDNVTLINKAVSNKKGKVKFFSEGADGGRIYNMSKHKGSSEVETICLDDIIEDEIDFLKMDIEGSESDVICSLKKINKIKEIFIEYHSFADKTQSLDELLSCLKENGFRYYIQTIFCSPRPLTIPKLQLGMDLQLNIFAKRV